MPIIYVLGGRTDATTPTDLVQKYYVYGFGAEYLVPWSQDFGFQTTCNQTDIWSPYFLRPDTDQFPGSGENFDPAIDDRREGGSGGSDNAVLPVLPEPLYGLMGVRVQSGVDSPSPDFPYGGFTYIYVFGGITASGNVSDQMLRWNPNDPQEQSGGAEEGPIQSVATMPSPRAYGKAVFIPARDYMIALVGGFDQNGVALNTVDVFTFDSIYNPAGGGWSTFEGTLPEALEACGAGYNEGYPGESWVLTMGGWTGEQFSHRMYTARIDSAGDQVIRELVVSVPRAHAGSTQSGSIPLSNVRVENMLSPITFNRYFVLGGVDENGAESIVESLSLP